MSWVMSNITCPQCQLDGADCKDNLRSGEEYITCGRCGYSETLKANLGEDGKLLDYVHEVRPGAGALFYRPQGSPGYCMNALHSDDDVASAERWLRERLSLHQVHRDTAYLTQWDDTKKTFIEVIGQIQDWEIRSKLSSVDYDLRPFQLVQIRQTRTIKFSCGHSGRATILVLERQSVPDENKVFAAFLPCQSCEESEAALRQDGAEVVNQSSRLTSRARFWENLAIDGTSDIVTPAFDHPSDLTSSSSLFYAAFPDRKISHPESIGFELQLTGWSDADIRDKKWLCDCTGCRSSPTRGCQRS
jgi:hypothetical protein